MNLKEILIELSNITRLNYIAYCQENQTNEYHWDGSLSYNGIKRMIFALWNDGLNEKGEDIISNMNCPEAIQSFQLLAEKVKNIKMPVLIF